MFETVKRHKAGMVASGYAKKCCMDTWRSGKSRKTDSCDAKCNGNSSIIQADWQAPKISIQLQGQAQSRK